MTISRNDIMGILFECRQFAFQQINALGISARCSVEAPIPQVDDLVMLRMDLLVDLGALGGVFPMRMGAFEKDWIHLDRKHLPRVRRRLFADAADIVERAKLLIDEAEGQ